MNHELTPYDIALLQQHHQELGRVRGFATDQYNERRVAQFDADAPRRSDGVKSPTDRYIDRLCDECRTLRTRSERAERRAFWAQVAAGFFGAAAMVMATCELVVFLCR